MLNIDSATSTESGVISLRDYIAEQSPEKPYKIVMFVNTTSDIRDVGDNKRTEFDLFNKTAKSLGLEIHHVDFVGHFLSESNGQLFVNSLAFDGNGNAILPAEDGDAEYKKPIPIDKENTLIIPRGLGTPGFTSNRYWVDTISLLEQMGFLTIPSVNTWNMCNSKFFCNELFKLNNLRTPKTVPITYSDDTARAMEQLGNKYPVILKASSGSQTGVGVVISESEKSLHATVQMIKLLSKNIDLILQEYIKIDYDVRAVVLDGKVIASMKRNVAEGDFRSNASLGATTEEHELTELEKFECENAAKLVNGKLIGVDFMPAKNREKEQPYILEVNASPGFAGIQNTVKSKNVLKEILKHFINRDNWT